MKYGLEQMYLKLITFIPAYSLSMFAPKSLKHHCEENSNLSHSDQLEWVTSSQ